MKNKKMRDIRFRVWEKPQEGFKGKLWTDNDPKFWASCLMNEKDEYELSQYTGLKDKNGVLVYEGDIVKWMPEEDKRDYTGFVFYFVDRTEYRINFGENHFGENHQFGFTTKSTEKEIEVIGNVWEGLYSGENSDVDIWKNNTEKQYQNPLRDTKSVKKQEEK